MSNIDPEDDGKSYRVVRMYFKDEYETEVVEKGPLTLGAAQRYCRDPETSSTTCTSEEGIARTKRCGPWFCGYEESKRKCNDQRQAMNSASGPDEKEKSR